MLLATINDVDLCLIIAVILFACAGVMRLMSRAFDATLIAVALAFFALAFLVNP